MLYQSGIFWLVYVYETQKLYKCKDDWAIEVEENLKFCDINLTEPEIQKMKRYQFKKIVSSQLRIKASEYLMSLRAKHSKSENLTKFSFQEYLACGQLTVEQQKLLFKLRTRSCQTKANYKNKYKLDLSCSYCKDINSEESDAHLLSCPFIQKSIADLQSVKHEDIFGEISKQVKIVKEYQKIFKFLETLSQWWLKEKYLFEAHFCTDYLY